MKKKNILSFLLLPLSWIYGSVVFIRNKLFDFGILPETGFKIPVISVGNITVGGTGKTPHIEYLIRILREDYKIAVLSRGYKRKSEGFILADENSDAGLIGDEPLQIKMKFPETIVAVDANRRNGITNLIALDKKIDVILLDDAFQHRYIKPGLSILLVDYNRPLRDDFILPSGSLRESASGRKRADLILVSGSPGNITPEVQKKFSNELIVNKSQQIYFSKVSPGEPVLVFRDLKNTAEEALPSEPSILLVSGIANPARLKQFAMKISKNITELQFSDHHLFSKNDIRKIIRAFDEMKGKEKILITTEKDAVRLQKYSDLPGNLKSRMFYIPICIEFINRDEENFNKQIISYVSNNK